MQFENGKKYYFEILCKVAYLIDKIVYLLYNKYNYDYYGIVA